MAHYLLGVWTPADATPPTPEQLESIMVGVDALQQEMRDAGVWVFAGGLEAPSTATVATASGDDVLITDGPFVELKEYLGGLTIIDVPDLDAALAWAKRSTRATTLPVEVRPFHWG